MSKSGIVPFGKYKGQPIEVLQNDSQYCNWLVAQDWFRDRYPQFVQVIVNNFTEPTETPEHNSFQAEFLDDCVCFGYAKLCGLTDLDSEGKQWRITRREFEHEGWDVFLEFSYWKKYYFELKPSMGDDYPAVLRQMKFNSRRHPVPSGILAIKKYCGSGATLEQVCKVFGESGFRIVIG